MNNIGGGVSRRLQRGQKILDNLSSNGVINPDSRNFLLAALDPYHDSEFPVPIGYPDGCTQRSVVRCINMSTTVGKEGEPTGAWNCIMSTQPFLDSIALRRTGMVPGTEREATTVIEWDGTTEGYSGPAEIQRFINIDQYEASDTTGWSDISRQNASIGGFEVEARYIEGLGRVIGVGIEVHNVTPELYRGGTVTVGEIPQSSCTDYPLNLVYRDPIDGGTGFNYNNVVSKVKPLVGRPDSLYEAMQYPGTRQWEAKDGIYMVLPLITTENEPSTAEYTTPMIEGPLHLESVSGTINTSPILVCPTNPGTTIAKVRHVSGPMKWTPLASKFAYFTGLSAETKLTFNVRVFYESFPTTADRDILPLATPSPDIDPHALALYQHCMTHLPIAVPVGENGLGEWFAQAVVEFSDVVGLGLSAMGVPFGAQMAGGAKALANTYLKVQSNKKKTAGKPRSTAPVLARQNKKNRKRIKNASGGVTMPLKKP